MIPEDIRNIAPTPEQAARIAEINARFEKAIQPLREEEERRMERYYDCQDDYGWGGVCSMVTEGKIRELEYGRDRMIESVIRGGFCIDETKFSRLLTIDGKPVMGARLVMGKYGWCWIVGDDEKFIGVPKRLKTLNDKGYTMELEHRIYKTFDDGHQELAKSWSEPSVEPCRPTRIDFAFGL